MDQPADRRRFPYYARRRNIPFELAKPHRDYDVVVVSSRADIEAWRRYKGTDTRLVYDSVNAYLAIPRRNPKAMLRGIAKFAAGELSRPVLDYRRSIERMARKADAIVCATEEQRSQFLPFCSNVHVVLDAHFEYGSETKQDYAIGPTLNLVWEGLPDTLSPLLALGPVLRDIARERPVALHVVTNLRRARFMGRFFHQRTDKLLRRLGIPTFLAEWNLTTAARIATACDVAVVPVDLDDPFARGKPENRLLIFWRMGLPTIASAAPSNERAMHVARVDSPCRSNDDWRQQLLHLASDGEARVQAALRGREYVEKHHSEAHLLERWDTVFRTIG